MNKTLGENVFKTKEKKRQEAEERNKLSKIKNAWKKELAAMEEKIELLEAKKSGHETAFAIRKHTRIQLKLKLSR